MEISEKEIDRFLNDDLDDKKVGNRQAKEFVDRGRADSENRGLLDEGMMLLGATGEAVDRVTGAPVRAGIGALQDEDPETGFFEAAYEQFGEPTSQAPTGKEIVQKMGVSDEPLVGDISAADTLGFGVDIIADPTLAVGVAGKAMGKVARSIKPVRVGLKNFSSKRAFKALADAATTGQTQKTLDKTRQEIVGRVLMEEDLGKYLNNPSKLLEKIQGKSGVKYTKVRQGSKLVEVPEKVRESGIISKISDETESVLKSIVDRAEKTDVDDMASQMIEKDVRLRLDPETASKLDESEINRYGEYVQKYLKPDKNKIRNVVQLQKLKKEIGKKLSSDTFFQPTDKSLAFEKMVMKDIYHTLKRRIEDSIKNVPVTVGGDAAFADDIVSMNNKRVSALMDVSEMLAKAPAKDLKDPNALQTIIDTAVSGAIGIGTAEATGNPYLGMAAAGGWAQSRGIPRKISEGVPAMQARAAEGILSGDILPEAVKKAALPMAGVRQGRMLQDEQKLGRDPQSVNNLPEQLIRTKISRNSESIIEQADIIKMKVAQQAPEMYDHIAEILDNQQEMIPDIIPAITQVVPHLFEYDKYGRVDGVILDPAKKELARQDLIRNEGYSNTEKMLMMDKLNTTGEFEL